MPGANDVAPAPDGAYVYVSGGGTTPLRRFDRAANGTFAQNHTWVPPTFAWEGETYPAKGRQIATDGYGNLYVANGIWTDELLHVVTKFAPDGRSLAVFGGFENTWDAGTFFALSGIGVSRDGRHVYTTEVHNNRVQRFDLQADGAYGYATMWGNHAASDPNRGGSCEPKQFAAPHDLAVDGWGDVWVASTSCTLLCTCQLSGGVPGARARLPRGRSCLPAGGEARDCCADGRPRLDGALVTALGGLLRFHNGC